MPEHNPAPEWEWAVQSKTFIDGPFDRLWLSPATGAKPYTEDGAKREAELMNKGRSFEYARAVHRSVSEWSAV